MDFRCSNSTHIEDDQLSKGFYKDYFKDELRYHNASSPFTSRGFALKGNNTSSFFMDSSFRPDPQFKRPLNLLYASNLGIQDASDQFLHIFNCTVLVARVESDIKCRGISCTIDRMRRSERDTRSSWYVPLNEVEFENMLLFLPFATGIPHSGTIAPIDRYLLASNAPFGTHSVPIAPSFSGVSGQVFS